MCEKTSELSTYNKVFWIVRYFMTLCLNRFRLVRYMFLLHFVAKYYTYICTYKIHLINFKSMNVLLKVKGYTYRIILNITNLPLKIGNNKWIWDYNFKCEYLRVGSDKKNNLNRVQYILFTKMLYCNCLCATCLLIRTIFLYQFRRN